MNETVEIHGDTGKVIITGVDISKHIDLSKCKPYQVHISQYLQSFGKPWEQEVAFK